ncbi:hypothetical protein ACWA1F_08035 [Flavobacterium sp. 3-218]
MEFKIKRLRSEHKKEKYLGTADTYLSKATIGFLSDSLEADSDILRKVIENYDYNLRIVTEGQYIILLDRKIESSSGIENDFYSGGTFLIGETISEVLKTKKIKTHVSPSFLIYKTIRAYAMPFLNWKRLINTPRILDRKYFLS